MNKQYQELQVEKDVYIPQPAMAYPEENPFERTLFPKYTKEFFLEYFSDGKGLSSLNEEIEQKEDDVF